MAAALLPYCADMFRVSSWNSWTTLGVVTGPPLRPLSEEPLIRKAVEVRAQPVDHRAVAVLEGSAGRIHRAGRQGNQVEDVAAVQREIADLARADRFMRRESSVWTIIAPASTVTVSACAPV